jgi:ferric-dicitrate binding protein FerR (iron transport regulator)
LVAKAKNLLESVKYERHYCIDDDNYNATLDTLLLFNNDSNFVQEERRITDRRRRIVWAAAVITIMVSFAGTLNWIYKKEIPVHEKPQYITKVVPKGVKTTLVLPDGTRVKLNSSSSLKYPSFFSSASRDVYLTGQAFFEVVENKKVPFLVHTKNFTTKVMGTSFDVRSYEDEQVQHVAVVTGKVKVEALNGLSEILVPDEMTIYKNNEMIRTSGFNRNVVLGWKDGLLQFKDSDFHNVTEQLSRWYGVEFDIEKTLKIKGRYTGSFRDESLENVLKGISFSSDFTFIIKDKTVLITQTK